MGTVYLSELANPILRTYLVSQGFSVAVVKKTGRVYDGVDSHPDIYMCRICGQTVAAGEDLGFAYPENIKYNGVQIGRHFLHNTKYTALPLMEIALANGLNIIHVNQGYTKCNTVVVDDESLITSDAGIAGAASENGIHVLLIQPGHVKLPGFPYGFLGGASGKIGNKLVFNGDLQGHPNDVAIRRFIEKRGLEIKDFPEYGLEDIGSIIFET